MQAKRIELVNSVVSKRAVSSHGWSLCDALSQQQDALMNDGEREAIANGPKMTFDEVISKRNGQPIAEEDVVKDMGLLVDLQARKKKHFLPNQQVKGKSGKTKTLVLCRGLMLQPRSTSAPLGPRSTSAPRTSLGVPVPTCRLEPFSATNAAATLLEQNSSMNSAGHDVRMADKLRAEVVKLAAMREEQARLREEAEAARLVALAAQKIVVKEELAFGQVRVAASLGLSARASTLFL